MKKLFIDFETRSAVSLLDVGAWKYAMDPSTDIMCMAFSYGDKVRVLTKEQIKTNQFEDGQNDTRIMAHNAHFEYAIWNLILHKRYGWPARWEPKYWGCTMSRAAMCNLPMSLEHCAASLGAKTSKDIEGRGVMLKLMSPIGIDPLSGEPIYNESPVLYQRLYQYCAVDVQTEMEIDTVLPELPPGEREVWEHDLIINRRGITADVETAKKAKRLVESLAEPLNSKLTELTGGAVTKASQLKELARFIKSKGVSADSLNKSAVIAMIDDESTPEEVRTVLRIRQQVGKSSTAKYTSMISVAADKDNRLRGLLQYHGAGTGRWGGRLVQPQNFPKGLGFDSGEVVKDVQELSEKEFNAKHGNKSMDALSAGLRGCLMAAPGNVLISADYSAIEARVLLWLAGDDLALEKYRQNINLYVDMAKFIYNNPGIDKKANPKEYAVGKAVILGCGYGMGWKRFRDKCREDKVYLDSDAPSDTWDDNLGRFLTKAEVVAAALVRAYRLKYKSVVKTWYAQEEAAKLAVKTKDVPHFCGKIIWKLSGSFLECQLPSGRVLRYYRPSIKTVGTPRWEKEEIHYWASGQSGKLAQFKTYGGSLVENITQAVARDIMANGMKMAEQAGYKVILTVHDELVTEVSENDKMKTVEGLVKAMCTLPSWAAGLPTAAEGWKGKRYRK